MMSLPGFAAEASLPKSNEHYKLVADKVRNVRSRRVIPQDCFWDAGCYYCCNERTGRCRLLYCVA
jgi:hypothetical protein